MPYQRQILLRQLGNELIGARSDRPDDTPVRVELPDSCGTMPTAALRDLFARLEAGRSPRVVLFTANSSAIVNFTRLDLPAHQAEPAAILAAEESYSGSPGELQVTAAVQASWTVEQFRQSTVLSVSEKNTVLESFGEQIASAGGSLVGVIPQRAAVASVLHAHALRSVSQGGEPDRILLHIGEDVSAVAVLREGRVVSLRTTSYGYGQMIDALLSAVHRLNPDANMHRATARQLFMTTGIPRPDEVVDESTGLTGRHLLPLFQPVVQRYALEIKHTLRLPTGDNKLGVCDLTGHGADIVGLSSTLERSVGIEVRSGENDATRSIHGAMAVPLQLEATTVRQLAMLPETVQWAKRKRRVYRALAAGTAAAGLLLAAEGTLVGMQTADNRAHIDELRPRMMAISQHDATLNAINAVTSEVRNAMTWTHAELGIRPVWSSLLGDLTTFFDANTELIEMRASDRSGSPALMLHWYEYTPSDGSVPATSMLDRLPQIPAVSEVVLQSRRKLIINGMQAVEFRVRADLHPLDNAALLSRMIAASSAAHDGDGHATTQGDRP